MKFYLATVFSPLVAAMSPLSADGERESIDVESHKHESLVGDFSSLGVDHAISRLRMAGCDNPNGPKPQVCMGSMVFKTACASCHTPQDNLSSNVKKQNTVPLGNELFKYLESPHPKKNFKGTKVFDGIKKPQDRWDLIAYLKETSSD